MDMKDFDLRKDEIIKHNRMIESAFGNLSINTFKLLMYLSSEFAVENMIEAEDFYKLSFKNSNFLKSIGYRNRTGYTDLKKYLRELKQAVVELPIWENDKKVGEVITGFILKAITYSDDSSIRKGTTTIWIDKDITPYLYQMKLEKENTILRYELMKKFESYFSARVYELLIRWKNTIHKKREFELQELKEKLGVKDKYNQFINFETKVLKVAKKEINQISDILIDYKKLSKGEIKGKGRRPITHIEFIFKMKYEQEEKDILTDNQKIKLMEIARKRVVGSNKTAEDFYSYAFGLALQGVSNKNSKTAYFKYIEKVLKDDQCFVGQQSMFADPEVRVAANKKAEKRIEETRKRIKEQEEIKKDAVPMPEEIRKKFKELNKNFSFDDEE